MHRVTDWQKNQFYYAQDRLYGFNWKGLDEVYIVPYGKSPYQKAMENSRLLKEMTIRNAAIALDLMGK